MWNSEDVDIQATSNSRWAIHAVVTARFQRPWVLSSVYGSTNKVCRKRVCDELRDISSVPNEGWMIMGDLNTILHIHEKSGGRVPTASQMEELAGISSDCGLIDLGANGPGYTWNNKIVGLANVKERLDRVLANSQWFSRFDKAQMLRWRRSSLM